MFRHEPTKFQRRNTGYSLNENDTAYACNAVVHFAFPNTFHNSDKFSESISIEYSKKKPSSYSFMVFSIAGWSNQVINGDMFFEDDCCSLLPPALERLVMAFLAMLLMILLRDRK